MSCLGTSCGCTHLRDCREAALPDGLGGGQLATTHALHVSARQRRQLEAFVKSWRREPAPAPSTRAGLLLTELAGLVARPQNDEETRSLLSRSLQICVCAPAHTAAASSLPSVA